MPAKPLDVGLRHFAKQGDATEFFKKMLGSYSVGDRVSDLDAIDLAALLERHRNKSEKIGVGISHFIVDADGYGKQCFWVVRADQTRIEFTYRRCITGIW